ncbi:DUF1616 domain-containing protein [Halocatena pleomorpha]|uniref:DUF1616 domain-containing protein n=1 Tax=Halocatena pleomorpha TaxID=1785090 RepID=A0A3P3RJS4_9EURY|nr:DUF1616 domain-containing protein [Halocatena pleomorpha]RRJ33662.1 DUF1616 domain-containing protein [Halocatena pleomorpha]
MTNTTDSWNHRIQIGLVLGEVIAVIGFVAAADFAVLSFPLPARVAVGLPLLFFFPGYALLSVLFPSSQFRTRYGALDAFSSGIDGIERAALSFGVSLALLPLIGLVLWTLSPVGFGVRVLLGVLSVEIGLGMIYGAYRRIKLPHNQRYRLPVDRWLSGLWSDSVDKGVLGTAMNLLLVLSVVAAVVALGYGVLVPNEAETSTGVSILTPSGGELTFVTNSTAVTAGDRLTLSITNREERTVTYTTVVVVQQIDYDGQRTNVRSSQELQRLQTTVRAGATSRVNHTVTPSGRGSNLRLRYLVYKGEPPAVPTAANAYRTVYIGLTDPGPTPLQRNQTRDIRGR